VSDCCLSYGDQIYKMRKNKTKTERKKWGEINIYPLDSFVFFFQNRLNRKKSIKKKKKILGWRWKCGVWSPWATEINNIRTIESITTSKARGGDGIPVKLFQILKDDAMKVLHSICQQIWNTQRWHRTGKGQFSFQSQRKAMPKIAQTTAQLHSFHTPVK